MIPQVSNAEIVFLGLTNENERLYFDNNSVRKTNKDFAMFYYMLLGPNSRIREGMIKPSVACFSKDHWYAVVGNNIELIFANSEASKKMLTKVCEQLK